MGWVPILAALFLLTSAWVVAEAWDPSPARRRAAVLAEALLGAAASSALVVYVAGEDDYRDNGISRWEAYDAEAITVAAVLAGAVVVVGALAAARRHRRGPLAAAGTGGLVAGVLLFLAFAANSLN